MKKFLKLLFMFLLPILIFFLPYFVGDPFMILRKYKIYYPMDGSPLWINNNRSYVSTQMYLQNNGTYHWDSFIFGSSRSGNFRVDDWKKCLGDESACFHFDGYGESLYNICKKVKYLDGKSQIKNAIICMDEMVLTQVEPSYGHLWILPPVLENGRNWSDWQMAHLKAYSNFSFLRSYFDFSLTHTVKPYMVAKGVIDTIPHGHYDVASNEVMNSPYLVFPEYDTSYYTSKIASLFPQRNYPVAPYNPLIKQKQLQMLSEIADVFKRNNTNYKIIISPDYNQKRYSPRDMHILDSLFDGHVFDFSGRNVITEDYHNYLDLVHFSPQVASELMRIVYIEDSQARQAAIDSLYVNF